MPISDKYFRLSGDDTQPLYQRIHDNLVQLIEFDLLKIGDALPSERHLSELYAVNRMTVRQAIDGLVQRGLITRRHGAGTFVADRQPVGVFTPHVIGFSQRMRDAGMNPSSRLLSREIIAPEPIVAHQLKLGDDEQVIMLKRLRLVNDQPLMIETSYLSHALFAGLMSADLENASLYQHLAADYAMRVLEAEHTMEPTMLNAFEAHHLGVERMMPAMLVRVIAYSADRIPIDVSKSIVRGDRCRYFFRVNTRQSIMT